MQKAILRVAVQSIRKRAEQNGWKWVEPHEAHGEDGSVTYTWFGNGEQGHERCRLVLCMEDDNIPYVIVASAWSVTSSRDVFDTYHYYLQVNLWARRSFMLWCEMIFRQVLKLSSQIMPYFNSR